MKFNEQYTVEKHIIKFISQNLGYEYITLSNLLV